MESSYHSRHALPEISGPSTLIVASCVGSAVAITALIGYDPRLGAGVAAALLSFVIVAIRQEWLAYAIVAITVFFVDGWLMTRSPDDVAFRAGLGRLYLMEIPVYLLALAYFCSQWMNKPSKVHGIFPRTPLDRPLWGWLLAFPIFAFYGVVLGNPFQDAVGYYEWRCLLLGIIFYFLVTGLFRRDSDRLRLFWWFFACAVLKAFYSLFLLLSHIDAPLPLVFGSGPVGEGPENLMYVFAALPAINLIVCRLEKNARKRTFLILGIFALVANVVLSTKRDPQLGLMVGCAVIGWRLPLREKLKWAAAVAALVLGVLLVASISADKSQKKESETQPNRYEEIVTFIISPGENLQPGDTFAFHILDLVDGWNTIKQQPLLGFGFGGQTQRELTLLEGTGGAAVGTGIVHNQYLTFWLKMGVCGLALYLWLLISFLWFCYTRARVIGQTYTSCVAIGFFAAICGDLGMELWGAGWVGNTKTPMLIFLAMALAVGFLARPKELQPLVRGDRYA